jgi:Domain of unknown function (DUF4126)
MIAVDVLTRILGLSFVSGINLYATVLVVGLSIRYDWVQGLPAELGVLAHPAVLIVAGVLYAVEFLADKVPVVASLWDVIHTFIRPAGGALLALAAVNQVHVQAPQEVIVFMVGAAVALGVHSTKMGVRLVALAAPHPVLHAGISLLEDLGVAGLLALMYLHRLAARILLLVLIAAIIFAAPLLFRIVSMVIRAATGRIVFWRAAFGKVPAWLADSVGGFTNAKGAGVCTCFVRAVPNVPRMKRGYLIRSESGLILACKGGGKARPLGSEDADKSSQGWMLDVITVCDVRGARSSIYLTKDQARRFYADSRTFDRASR